MVLLFIVGLMVVMNAVNLVFLAARNQMKKRRKRNQQPG
jgi:preprotein translocase subunit YajC